MIGPKVSLYFLEPHKYFMFSSLVLSGKNKLTFGNDLFMTRAVRIELPTLSTKEHLEGVAEAVRKVLASKAPEKEIMKLKESGKYNIKVVVLFLRLMAVHKLSYRNVGGAVKEVVKFFTGHELQELPGLGDLSSWCNDVLGLFNDAVITQLMKDGGIFADKSIRK